MKTWKLYLELAWMYFGAQRRWISTTTVLALGGMTLGVASLVVAMAVVSGYETTLRNTVIDFMGEVLVFRRGTLEQTQTELNELKEKFPEIKESSPFVYVDAAIVHKGKLNGIVLNGVDPESSASVLKLKDRIVEGSLDLSDAHTPGAVVGQEIAKKFELKVGDSFKIVLPVPNEKAANGFIPRAQSFKVVGILNIGRYDFDSRYILVHLAEAQQLAQLGDRVTGYRLKLDDYRKADQVVFKITQETEGRFQGRSWRDANYNLFQAVQVEKVLIFSVLLIMIVAASFNVSNHLYVSVIRRYRDISILQTLGVSRRGIAILFSFQGLIVGAIGVGMGIFFGLLMSEGFVWAQNRFGLISGKVYKLTRIDVEWRFTDLLAVTVVSLLICFLFSLAPAWRGSKMSPTEGLRYD